MRPPESSPDAWSLARKALDEVAADAALAGLPAVLQRVCRAACASVTSDGAAVQVMSDAGSGTVLASSDQPSSRVAEAAFEVGEGPCLDAFSTARPIQVPDLTTEGFARWPGFASVAGDLGFSACFSFPLQLGAVRLGALDLYRRRTGGLTRDERTLALVFADVARDNLLDSPQLSPVEALDAGLSQALETRAEIHQAQGMVTIDLDVDLDEAMTLMRSHAFRQGVPLIEVARSILAGAKLTDSGN
jgi:hypothetical protein